MRRPLILVGGLGIATVCAALVLALAFGEEGKVMVGAGDIAKCDGEGDEGTAALLDGIEGTVFTLGDNVYERGTAAEYAECYEPTWGRHKARTRPVPGNHEYETPGAAGYFDYFGAAAGERGEGYYSYDVGEWHIVALNSMCREAGGCGPDSPQVRWLKDDLAANRDKACTLAYFHYPLFNAGERGTFPNFVGEFWDVLYAEGADVVLSAHDHNYQRFAPQSPDGAADPARGIRQFVTGSGGGDHYEIKDSPENLEAYNEDTYGVLKLTLRANDYDWRFVPVEGGTFTDSGGARCH